MSRRLLRRFSGGHPATATTAIIALAAAGTILAAPPAQAASPDFGPNVTIFDENWSTEDINAALQAASHEDEFSLKRHQFFFAPGTYGSAGDPGPRDIINSDLGYYQSVSGLGASPDDVRINGAIHVEPVVTCPGSPWDCQQPGSLTRFWRSMSNLSFNPIQEPVGEDITRPFPAGVTDPGSMRFAVSQAAPLRRIHVEGDLTVFGRFGEYASGGYLADSKIDGTVFTGSQQQWFTRNSSVGAWDGGVWNNVMSGVTNAPATNFGTPKGAGVGVDTTIDKTPISREIPFLYLDGDEYRVFVPKAHTNTTGVNWSVGADAGDSLNIDTFYIAKKGDTAASINSALAAGKNLLLTPEVYFLDAPLKVTRANTVVLGLGYASLVPRDGTAAIEIGDVAGVKLAGITVDAHTKNSDVLVQVGPRDATAADAANPTTLSDVFIRVGGPWAGNATTSIEVNSPNTLLDHIWAWRADHGDGVDWHTNVGDHGVIVNGDNVTATGLFVEHYGKNQVIWNGNNGRTIFYQSELPYDPPTQADYMDGDRKGFSSYRVADSVTSHLAQGLGVYSFFDDTRNNGNEIFAESSIEAPRNPNVRFESLTSVYLNGTGGINHVINDQGSIVKAGPGFQTAQIVSYPPADTTAPRLSVSANPSRPGPDGFYTSKVTLTVTATDDFLPAPTVQYRFLNDTARAAGETEWLTAQGPIVLGNGSHSVEIRAVDGSGNVSDVVSWSGLVRVPTDDGGELPTSSPSPSSSVPTSPTPTPSNSVPTDGGTPTTEPTSGTSEPTVEPTSGTTEPTVEPTSGTTGPTDSPSGSPTVIATDDPDGELPGTGSNGVPALLAALMLLAAGLAVGAARRARALRS
ncbi:PT domain-containing protein [Mycetocola tolaasinivorans]|uniref:PT domain-containing protein n=1 Tax=Mycetocola tolaasinivorans TaxID=76635 RepID=UPI001602574D|nr:PT domain-containing protein [Mycetocola tolaasinivorans]